VLHYNASSWKRFDSGYTGDLWWVFGFEGGPVYMGGAGGMILRYEGGSFTKMNTPGADTVFGIWGTSPSDMWAVGGAIGGAQGAFAWRSTGNDWVSAPGFPTEITALGALWKVFGRSANDVWMVGTNGILVRWDGSALSRGDTGLGESLFTVHASSQRFAAVGGGGTGIILENDGSGWSDVSPNGAPVLVGVYLSESAGYAVGRFGAVFSRTNAGWQEEATGVTMNQTLHSVWIDPGGGVWAAGGQVLQTPLVEGVLLHKGPSITGAFE
jgi:hypothetical protein